MQPMENQCVACGNLDDLVRLLWCRTLSERNFPDNIRHILATRLFYSARVVSKLGRPQLLEDGHDYFVNQDCWTLQGISALSMWISRKCKGLRGLFCREI